MIDYSNKNELLGASEEEVTCLSRRCIENDDASQNVPDDTYDNIVSNDDVCETDDIDHVNSSHALLATNKLVSL
jgi:hypothetical protein